MDVVVVGEDKSELSLSTGDFVIFDGTEAYFVCKVHQGDGYALYHAKSGFYANGVHSSLRKLSINTQRFIDEGVAKAYTGDEFEIHLVRKG